LLVTYCWFLDTKAGRLGSPKAGMLKIQGLRPLVSGKEKLPYESLKNNPVI
jgi:hypothetical protein